jgi:hypothetical protein
VSSSLARRYGIAAPSRNAWRWHGTNLRQQGISLSVDQYKEFLKVIPAINEQLRKEGHDVDDVGESGSAEDQENPKAKKTKKESSRKANIEATSDEESD